MTAPQGQGPFLCVGAALWDVIARAGHAVGRGDDLPGTISRRPGGVALNVAVGLVSSGCDAQLCSVIGADPEGDTLLEHLRALGVDCSPMVRTDDTETDRYVAIEDATGDLVAAVASVQALEARMADVVTAAMSLLPDARSLFLDANLQAGALEQIADRAHALGVEVIANPVSPTRAGALRGLLTLKPTLITNLAEANAISGGTAHDALSAARALVELGAGSALVTHGGEPSALATPEAWHTAAPSAVLAGVSVTGAGDAFIAEFLASASRYSNPQAALEQAMEAAMRAMQSGIGA
ncbi:MAG: PfkB family carbohydrate kinase [Pseudomonadota bacterium]